MDELSNWCEIEGHDFKVHFHWFGPDGLSVTEETVLICKKCFKLEHKIYVPFSDHHIGYSLLNKQSKLGVRLFEGRTHSR